MNPRHAPERRTRPADRFDAFSHPGQRFAPERVDVRVLSADRHGRAGRAPEIERYVRLLERLDLAVCASEAVELAFVVERFLAGPDAPQHIHVFTGAAVAGVVVLEVTVAPLIR